MTSWLDEVRARLANATAGPWKAVGDDTVQWVEPVGIDDLIGSRWSTEVQSDRFREDAALIAAAPTDLARLLAVAQAVQALFAAEEALAEARQAYANARPGGLWEAAKRGREAGQAVDDARAALRKSLEGAT